MIKARLAVAVVAAIIASLALAGCAPASLTSKESTIDKAAQAQVDTLRKLPFGESNVAIITRQLRAAGVEIASTWKDSSTAVVRATRWQVQNMAAEAANGGGVSGAQLEALHATPKGAPPVDYLISAWAISYDSDAARFAHALLGSRDFHHPQSILFPSVVTTLFLADATKGDKAKPLALGPSIQTVSAPSVSVGSICNAVAKFTDNAIDAVVNALHIDVSNGTGFWHVLGTIWNVAVSLAAKVVKGLIDAITRPVTQIIVSIFGAVETLRQLSTYLYVWRTKLVNDPDSNKFGVDGKKEYGRVTLSILDNRLPIPDEIVQCAAAFGVDVKDAGSANGSAVTWDPQNTARPDLSATYTSEAKIDENQTARYQYTTGQESAKLAAGGDETLKAGFLRLSASVQRNDIEKVRALFVHLVFDQVPSSIRSTVEDVAKPVVDSTTTLLTSLTDVKAETVVLITYHGDKNEKKPRPGARATCPASGVFPGHYVGSDTMHDVSSTFDFTIDWVYKLDVTAGPGGALQGTMTGDSSASPSGEQTHHVYTIGGTVSAPTIGGSLASSMPQVYSAISGDCSHLDWKWDFTHAQFSDPGGDTVVDIHAPLVP